MTRFAGDAVQIEVRFPLHKNGQHSLSMVNIFIEKRARMPESQSDEAGSTGSRSENR